MQYKRIAGFMIVPTMLASCTLFKTSCLQTTVANRTDADSVSVIYNDSVDNIFLNAGRVRIYDMADFTMSCDSAKQRNSLFNYEINKNIGFLETEEKAILAFIISDKSWYIKNYAPIRQPFHPNIAFEFANQKHKAFMFVSFGTEEVAISDIEGNFRFYQMRDKLPMVRWACLKFPEEKYYEELLKP